MTTNVCGPRLDKQERVSAPSPAATDQNSTHLFLVECCICRATLSPPAMPVPATKQRQQSTSNGSNSRLPKGPSKQMGSFSFAQSCAKRASLQFCCTELEAEWDIRFSVGRKRIVASSEPTLPHSVNGCHSSLLTVGRQTRTCWLPV